MTASSAHLASRVELHGAEVRQAMAPGVASNKAGLEPMGWCAREEPRTTKRPFSDTLTHTHAAVNNLLSLSEEAVSLPSMPLDRHSGPFPSLAGRHDSVAATLPPPSVVTQPVRGQVLSPLAPLMQARRLSATMASFDFLKDGHELMQEQSATLKRNLVEQEARKVIHADAMRDLLDLHEQIKQLAIQEHEDRDEVEQTEHLLNEAMRVYHTHEEILEAANRHRSELQADVDRLSRLAAQVHASS